MNRNLRLHDGLLTGLTGQIKIKVKSNQQLDYLFKLFIYLVLVLRVFLFIYYILKRAATLLNVAK